MDRPHATVVLDIFSGRPDPSWKLDAATAAELQRKLAALPPAHERTLPPEGGLGYRGLHVSLSDGAHGGVVEVRNGRIAYAGRILRDEHRTVERWLLDTAPPDVRDLARLARESF
jgi:hypothetical protein